MTLDHKKMNNTFKHNYQSDEYGLDWLPPEVLSQVKANVGDQKMLDEEWEKLCELKETLSNEVFPDGDSKQHVPINITRMIGRAKQASKNVDLLDRDSFYTP